MHLAGSTLVAAPAAAVLFERNSCAGPFGGGALSALPASTADFGGALACRNNSAAAGRGGCIAAQGADVVLRGGALFEGAGPPPPRRDAPRRAPN